MGVLSKIKGIFRKEKKEPLPPKIPPKPKKEISLEPVTVENVKAKMELMLTQLDSLKTQYDTMNERVKNIERLVKEIRSFCR